MNSAINSSTISSRPLIFRRSKSYRQKIFRRILYGLPVVAGVGWEYRVWKRKLYYDRNREHFPGATSFYGKMWGYESDNMIEESLGEGDLVFWSAHPLSIHLHEAIARFPFRHLKGDYDAWDYMGIVAKRPSDGAKVVVGPLGDSVLYSDLVADYRTSSVAVRSLVDTSVNGLERQEIMARLKAKQSPTTNQVHVGFLGFLENSLKALSSSCSIGFVQRIAMSFVRPETLSFPFSILKEGLQFSHKPVEINDVFNSTVMFNSCSYSPPFFVRRLDNEYLNHNRTRNVVVDWEMLQQREIKNKLVAGGESR